MTNIAAVVALMASQIGAPLPVDIPAVVVPAAIAKAAPAPRAAAASGYVSASGMLSGSGYMHCSAPQNGSGWMSGSVHLTANFAVRTPEGLHGNVPVSGTVFLTGSCQNGGGFLTGSANVSGYGNLYLPDGTSGGTIRLDGSVFVNQYASSSFVWINQYATLSGYSKCTHWRCTVEEDPD